MIFYIVGYANVVLQLLTRNIGFGVFGMVCFVMCAFSLAPKLKKISLMTRLALLISVSIYCLYCHYLYGGYISDYILITIEAMLCVALSIIYSIPIKKSPTKTVGV